MKSPFHSSAYQALSDRLAEEGWSRSMLALLCEIRLLPETLDCPAEER